jgi:hypothetical protein
LFYFEFFLGRDIGYLSKVMHLFKSLLSKKLLLVAEFMGLSKVRGQKVKEKNLNTHES